jgi:hypothetical protein
MTSPLRSLLIASLLTPLVALPNSANGQSSGATARVRVIHASPDAPSVDVLVNDELALFTSARFGDVTDYAEVPANVYDVKVVPAGGSPASAAIQADLNLFYGTDYTVIAVGTGDDIRPIVLVDDNSQPTGNEARVRFVHAVPDAPAVDIKVADGPYLFQDISFEALGDYVTIPRSRYGIEVRVAGTDTVVLELPEISFRGGSTYTLLATGLLADDSLGVAMAEDNFQQSSVTPLPRLPERPLLGVNPQISGSLREDQLR